MSAVQPWLFPDAAAAPTLRELADAVREAGVEALAGARTRADRARYQEVRVRSALAATRGMSFAWGLNPYRGCTHACVYCYARKYQRHLELDAGDDFSSTILVKTNLVSVLERELHRQSWARELVAVGTATDPYQPIEGHYRLTRRALEALVAAETPFSVVTKGPMILRDLDVLERAAMGAGCQVYMSVPSADDEACARLEPGTAPPAQRLRAVRVLADAGVDAGVLMMPLVPGITATAREVARTLEAIAAAGARFVGAGVARLDPGVREFFLSFLAREYPELTPGYRQLYPAGRTAAPRQYTARVRDGVDRHARRLGLRS